MSRHAVSAEGLRLALFTDTYAPQVNGVARTLERLVAAVEARGGAVRVFTVHDPDASSAAGVGRFPSRAFWAYPQLRLAWPRQRVVRSELEAFQRDPRARERAVREELGWVRRDEIVVEIPSRDGRAL